MNDDLISRKALYEKTAEWEAQALHMVEIYHHDEDLTAWRMWTVILNERTAFKHDVADAPSAEPRVGRWITVTNGRGGFECSECHQYAPSYMDGVEWLSNYCPNCGAKMEEDENE